jgi:hypothetical protein
MKFDLFVIPFTAGLIFLLCYLVGLYAWWFYKLEKSEKRKVLKGFFSFKLFPAVKEIIMESLLHKRIFGKNMLLGFMHMSLAFGWFLLILVGNIEDRIYDPETLNPRMFPYSSGISTQMQVISLSTGFSHLPWICYCYWC